MDRIDDFSRLPPTGAAALISEHGLVQTEGSMWRNQREDISPGFGSGPLKTYVNAVAERATALRDEWDAAVDAGEPERDLHHDMTGVTVRAASKALFGADIGPERAAEMHRIMRQAATEFEVSPTALTPDWFPDPLSAEAQEMGAALRAMGEDVIERKRAERDPDGPPQDMLDFLLLAEASGDRDYPENHLRDQVVSFLIAGHETTALGTTYTQALLSWHPEIRQRVREEAREVIGDDDPGYEHASDLTYTGKVFTEALRLYPPAWTMFRTADGPQSLGGYGIDDGALVLLPQWSVHRDGTYFDNPREFDPSRWDDRGPSERPAYFAFASGPHACIGRGFAENGARIALATLVRDFDLDVPRGELSNLMATVTLRPGNGVDATLSRAE
jgi:cytochrome P450